MSKKSHLSHKSQDVVIVPHEDDRRDPRTTDAYIEPSFADLKRHVWARERIKTVFKGSGLRHSSAKSRYSAYSLKGKCYIILFLQFLRTAVDIWWHSRKISTRAMRKIVVVEIALMIILGFVFTVAGVFKITHYTEDEHTSDFYWAITLVAVVVLTLAIMGSIGIFRPSIRITEIFAVFSFIFGHLIFSIVISWYLLVVLDSILSDGSIERLRDQKQEVIDNNIYKDTFLQDYFKLLIVISLVMMSSGVITTKLLIQIRKNQGYVNVFAETTHK